MFVSDHAGTRPFAPSKSPDAFQVTLRIDKVKPVDVTEFTAFNIDANIK